MFNCVVFIFNYMRLFYIYSQDPLLPFVGVYKKIQSQIEVFEKSGFDVCEMNIFTSKNILQKIINRINPFSDLNGYKSLLTRLGDISNSVFYIRFMFFDYYFFLFLLKMKNNNNKIVIEFPTYPFKKEIPLNGLSLYYFHLFYSLFVRKYIDFCVTYSLNIKIYGINTILIQNGINVEDYPLKRKINLYNELNLIIVANLSKWHGIDRLINGMYFYDKSRHDRNVFLHIVGRGSEMSFLQTMVDKLNLRKKVFFYGELQGDKLNNVFDNMHIGIGSLGCHRKDLFVASELKSREYAIRGLPFIISVNMLDFPSDFKYVKYFNSDESFIDVNEIISFAENIYQEENFDLNIRNWAIENLSWEKKMLPVLKNISIQYT